MSNQKCSNTNIKDIDTTMTPYSSEMKVKIIKLKGHFRLVV